MKISASLYSNTSKNQEQLIEQLERCYIDFFHIDSIDDLTVFQDISRIQKISKTPIDLHIISAQPEKYFQEIAQLQIKQAAIQYEHIENHPIRFPNGKTKWGIAITTHTPIDVFTDYSGSCSYVLMMTTIPGESGGLFQKVNFQRIRKFRNQFPQKEIFVDGGVNDEVSFILRILGVTGMISGSYLVNHQSIGEAILHLKSSIIHSNYQIKDFMMELPETPIVSEHELSVSSIILSIEKGDLGFTLIKANNGALSGLVSNADLRKALIKNLDNLNNVKVDDLINKTPVRINENATISDLLLLINQSDFLVSFLPVIDNQNNLKGALSFAHLIRSES